MKAEIKKLDSCKRELNIEVDKERVIKKFDEVYNRIGEKVEVKGFRIGKAPRNILERDYKDLASQEVIKELIPEVCKEIIEREKIPIVDSPHVTNVLLNLESLSFKITFEVKPEVRISGYKRIKINCKKIEVSEDEIRKVIETLKEERRLEGELTDDFAHRFGHLNLSDLEETIRSQLYLEKQSLQRQSLEDQIIQNLLRLTSFSLPSSLVNKRLAELVEREKFNLALRGIPEEQIRSKEKDLREKLKENAEEQVRIFLILEKIATQENIPLDENMPRNVMEFLLSQAIWGD